MHDKITDFFGKYEMSEETQQNILQALDIVWQNDNEQKAQKIASARKAIVELRAVVRQQAESAANPDNELIKDEPFSIIREKKAKIIELEAELERLMGTDEQEKESSLSLPSASLQKPANTS